MSACPRCKRRFKNSHGLGQHQRAYREALGPTARARICPDNRSDDEAKSQDARLARNKVRMRDPEMVVRVMAYLGLHP